MPQHFFNPGAKDGQAVHYGVRPGDIGIAAAGQGIEAKVVVVEPTGAETELLLDVGGTQMIVVLHGRTAAQPDDMVGLQIEASNVHRSSRRMASASVESELGVVN